MSNCTGVLIVGAKGSIATTLFAAQCAKRRNLNLSFKCPSEFNPDFASLGLIDLADITFGGWDLFSHSYSKACQSHRVIPPALIETISADIDRISSFPAITVFEDESITKLLINETPLNRPFLELIEKVENDISLFKKQNNFSKVIVVNLASTAKTMQLSKTHLSIEAFEEGIRKNDQGITSAMLYAYAAMKSGCHLINFTPSTMFDTPALYEMAERQKVGLAGKDGKTGQTLYKTVIAPMLKQRGLKLTGWFSTNILGNRDGKVLNDPNHCASKIDSKSGVLNQILGYDDFDHQVNIHYYNPRGEVKEAWDNIDFKGWFDVPMQMKINWIGNDSILAAPLVLDLIRWVDFFTDRGENGILTQLASHFKVPLGTEEHDFSKQLDMLKKHVNDKYKAQI